MSEEMKNLNEQPEQAPVENKPEAKLPLSKKQLGIIGGIAAAVIVLIVVLAIALGGSKAPATPDNGGDVTPPAGEVVTESEYKLGLGLVFGDINATQTNATIATVVLDKDGKIVACKIDCVQNKYTIAETVTFTVLESKKELGNRYNMAAYGTPNYGDTVLEWFEQAAAFENFIIGKTAAEVAEMGKEENLQFVNNHWISKDEDLLKAGCTIQIGEFVDAVVKACNDDQGMSFKTSEKFTLGLGVNNADNGTSGDDFEATIKMNIDFAATVVAGGKILATVNDAAQPQLTVIDAADVSSTSVGKGEGILKTKRELKEDYKMAAFGAPNVEGGTVKEWYIQSAAFSNYVVGKTADQVKNLETQLVNNHYISTDSALLNAGCTMLITGIMDVVVEAVNNAK